VQTTAHQPQAPTAIRTDLGAIFVSMELSRTSWLLTSVSPGDGERMSKHAVRSGDVAGLRARFSLLKEKVRTRTGLAVSIIVIQEAGLDGFWIHRLLLCDGIESYVVDPASIATSRRRRRAKTDKIDGEALVRALLAYKRGEPRVCAMVRAPTPQEEDRRRICRERKTLTAERVEHVNRIKGLLFAQGIADYEPLLRKRRERLDELRTGDGRPLPQHLKAQVGRELDRLELVLQQMKSVEAERDASPKASDKETPTPAAMLKRLKGIGPEGSDRGPRPKAADRVLEICDRRCSAGRCRDNGSLKTSATPFNLPGPDQLRSIQVSGPRSGLAEESRRKEWSRPPEPRPTQAGYWCSRYESGNRM